MSEVVATARERVDRIKALVGAARSDIIDSYRQRDWIALGYDSWDGLCSAEFGTVLRLSIEDRQQAVAELSDAGMSSRAIGAALGVGIGTVSRDLSGVPNGTPARPTTGLDGKTYPPRPPVEDPSQRDPEPEEWTGEELDIRLRMENDPRLTVPVNLRSMPRLVAWAEAQDRYARIDRRTDWGNPFILDQDGDRDTVIANYRDHYLPLKPSLDPATLVGKALGCWCAPLPCHGDALR